VTLSHTPSYVVKKKKRNINNDLAILPSHDIWGQVGGSLLHQPWVV